MLKEFKEFAVRGNVIDMAVGVIVGGAFGTIVKSLVDDVIMPPIGLVVGGIDFSNLFATLKPGNPAGPYLALADAKKAGAVTVNYGLFINGVISFLIVAFAVFLLVRSVNALRRRLEAGRGGAAGDERLPVLRLGDSAQGDAVPAVHVAAGCIADAAADCVLEGDQRRRSHRDDGGAAPAVRGDGLEGRRDLHRQRQRDLLGAAGGIPRCCRGRSKTTFTSRSATRSRSSFEPSPKSRPSRNTSRSRTAQLRSAQALNVAFLAAPLGAEARKSLMALRTDIDDFHVNGREVYWLCRKKQSESTFSNIRFEKSLASGRRFAG